MSVETQIERIKANVADTYTAAQAKGATMPEVKNSDNLASCVSSIPTSGGTQFGLTAEQMLGTVDGEGNLTLPTLPSITFTGLGSIPSHCFYYKFVNRTFETGSIISFPDLTNVGIYGMSNAFFQAENITSTNLSALTTVGNYGLYHCFYLCTNLTSANLSALTTVGDYGLAYCFYFCRFLPNIILSALATVGAKGMVNCFGGCTSLTNISFPALTSVQTDSFGSVSYNYCFSGCTALTEIHFRADAQTAIEGMTGYADKWGATNATIYFDL